MFTNCCFVICFLVATSFCLFIESSNSIKHEQPKETRELIDNINAINYYFEPLYAELVSRRFDFSRIESQKSLRQLGNSLGKFVGSSEYGPKEKHQSGGFLFVSNKKQHSTEIIDNFFIKIEEQPINKCETIIEDYEKLMFILDKIELITRKQDWLVVLELCPIIIRNFYHNKKFKDSVYNGARNFI